MFLVITDYNTAVDLLRALIDDEIEIIIMDALTAAPAVEQTQDPNIDISK